MNIFQYIPENLFNLFISKNRMVYSYALIELFIAYEKGPIYGIEKPIAQQIIIECLASHELVSENEEDIKNEREKANYILRKFEETGFIYVETDFNFAEWIVFPDYSINLMQAFLKIVSNDNEENYLDTNFKGYIFTIYTLLNSADNFEFATMIDEVYRNTRLFIRELRKIDSRLKFYLKNMFEETEIKELMFWLMNHKDEVLDKAYLRLKTSDNVNKYRHFIIKRLEEIQNDGFAMNMIINEFIETKKLSTDEAIKRADKQINEIIDTFKDLESFIREIDEKNKTYINSTINKIKFLLNTDNDIVGQINLILKHIEKETKKGNGKLEKIEKLFGLNNNAFLDSESLAKSRGSYRQRFQNILSTENTDFEELRNAFMLQYNNEFSEIAIVSFVNQALEVKPEIKASEIFTEEAEEKEILRLLFIVAYSGLENYEVDISEDFLKHNRYSIKDFTIRKEEKL